MQLRRRIYIEWLVNDLTLWQRQEWSDYTEERCFKTIPWGKTKITNQKAKWAKNFRLGHFYTDSFVMLHRKANMLIIKCDCCLPHLKTEGNEVWNVKSKWPCWDHWVNATERNCSIHCTPLVHREEEGITNYWFLFPWIYKLQGETWTQNQLRTKVE